MSAPYDTIQDMIDEIKELKLQLAESQKSFAECSLCVEKLIEENKSLQDTIDNLNDGIEDGF